MPYTIIVCDDNSLYGSCKKKIMQREKLFNELWILAPSCYNGYNMSRCTVIIRYLMPISKEFKTETLVLSDEKYEEYLRYTIPIDTCLTKEFGDIRLNLTFIMLDKDENGNVVQRVRKTDDYVLTVTKISDWDSVVPDEALQAIDQRIIAQSAQIRALEELANAFDATQVDNLIYNENTNELQLSANGNEIGNKVVIKTGTADLEDGVPVVDFGSVSNEDEDTEDEDTNVVEF